LWFGRVVLKKLFDRPWQVGTEDPEFSAIYEAKGGS
jgi:hypothetical protein